MMNIKYLLTIIATVAFSLVGVTFSTQAEDIEIFFTESNQTAPNVLFMLDTSGSMNEKLGDQTRMQILKNSLNQVLSRDYVALNVGIMDFNRNRGGGIDFPVKDINADAHDIDADIPKGEFTVSRLLKESFVNHYTPDTFTPMGDAFYRASSYFRGDEILYTDGWGKPHRWNNNKKKYEGGHVYSDHSKSYEGAKWGETGLQGTREINCLNQCVSGKRKECRGGSENECVTVCDRYENICTGTETYNIEGFDGIPKYISPIINQCQKNYIVLLSDGEPTSRLMRDNIAERVKPESHVGDWNFNNCESLDVGRFGGDVSNYGRCLPDLTKYMSTVDQSPTLLGDQTVTTYTVGFAIENNNKLREFLKLLSDKDHGQGDYFDANSAGELVKVFQSIIDTVTTGSRGFVAPTVSIDMDNRLTTSEYVYMTKFTPENSPGWKGDIIRYRVDGSGYDESSALSLADQLTNSRKVYTYTGSRNELTDASNKVAKNNTNLTSELLNSSVDEREAIILWARGIDSRGGALKHMGSSLHTKPAIVSYANKKNILYATTNDGFLHAFDVSNTDAKPSEIFAFIPQELLPNLKILMNNVTPGNKLYGLDGGMTVWKQKSSNGNDQVTLYFGMRRGGRNYYALDVTDPEAPRLKWIIKGGDGDFKELGQSWSTPQLVKVTHDGEPKMALIIGGGYDTNQDDTSKLMRNDDSVGRAIFIVDADTGGLLWSVDTQTPGFSELKNSIPSNIRAVDLDSNGLADRLYFGDTGGRVWRIDLNESDVAKSTGYQLADFNDGTAEGNRRFYYAPSIAYSRDRKLMITIGSGYRAHPLATGIQNRFYAIEDTHAKLGAPSSVPAAINESDMKNVTNAGVSNSETTVGWYFDLSENEKVLAESLIFNNNVSFTTYTPDFGASGDNTCSLAGATAKAYVVHLRDGKSALGAESGGYERSISLDIKSIPGAPYVVFNKPESDKGSPTADIYVEKQKIGEVKHITERLFWRKDK